MRPAVKRRNYATVYSIQRGGPGPLPAFKSADAYKDFARRTTQSVRYTHDGETQEFLNTLVEQSKDRTRTWPSESICWRAQIGHVWEPTTEDGQHIGDLP